MLLPKNDLSEATGLTAEARRPRLTGAGALARLAIIGVALAAVVGRFAYFGGWFTPYEPTAAVEDEVVSESLVETEPLPPTPNPPRFSLVESRCSSSD